MKKGNDPFETPSSQNRMFIEITISGEQESHGDRWSQSSGDNEGSINEYQNRSDSEAAEVNSHLGLDDRQSIEQQGEYNNGGRITKDEVQPWTVSEAMRERELDSVTATESSVGVNEDQDEESNTFRWIDEKQLINSYNKRQRIVSDRKSSQAARAASCPLHGVREACVGTERRSGAEHERVHRPTK